MSKIVIIGNGIAGVTAARHVRKLDDSAEILIISSETKHFYSRTALMYIFMGHMRFKDTKPYEDWFWEKNRIDLLHAHVNEIDFQSKTLLLANNEKLTYDKLVIATGSKPNKFGWPGQDSKGVQGLYSYQDLELLEQNTAKPIKRAVIVGGGLIGVELAEMLSYKKIPVTFLVRENCFWGNVLPKEEGDMIAKHMINDHHIDLRFEQELDEIIANDNNEVTAVTTKKGEKINCDFVGLTAGVSPNVDFLKSTDLKIERGIIVNEYLETNIPDVYAIGDCAQIEKPTEKRKSIEAVWYVGRMMGETLARTLTGSKLAYQPGIWFNSAKFFDIEYQTYGIVNAKQQEGEEVFYWQFPSKNLSLRFVYDSKSKALLGINTFGIRLRHKICDNWIKSKTPIDKVLTELRNANFDPEFFKPYEQEVVDQFNKENNTDIKLKKKNLFQIFG